MSLANAGLIKITHGSTTRTFAPKKLNLIYDTLATEDSGRTDDGVMHISWIIGEGQTVESIVKVEIEMPPCSAADATNVLSLVQGKTYNMEYYDLREGGYRTKTFYTSTSQGDCYCGLFNSATGLWEGISFNAISTGEN